MGRTVFGPETDTHPHAVHGKSPAGLPAAVMPGGHMYKQGLAPGCSPVGFHVPLPGLTEIFSRWLLAGGRGESKNIKRGLRSRLSRETH